MFDKTITVASGSWDVNQLLLIVFDKFLLGKLHFNWTGSDSGYIKTRLDCLYFPKDFQTDQIKPIIWEWGNWKISYHVLPPAGLLGSWIS